MASIKLFPAVCVCLLAVTACGNRTPAPVVYGTAPQSSHASQQAASKNSAVFIQPATASRPSNTTATVPLPPPAKQTTANGIWLKPVETANAPAAVTDVPLHSIQNTAAPSQPRGHFLQPALETSPASGSVYTVKRGDTLYSISRNQGRTPQQLAAANNLRAPYTLRQGQRLRIPAADLPANTPLTQVAATAPARTNAATITPPPRTNNKLAWPLQGKIIAGFGNLPNGQRNDGINIEAAANTPVKAADNGVVAYAGNQLAGYGNLILIRHSGNLITAYAHNNSLLVKKDDVVKRGDVIARVGNTGNVRTPQLHFEVREGKKPVNPLQYLEDTRIAQR